MISMFYFDKAEYSSVYLLEVATLILVPYSSSNRTISTCYFDKAEYSGVYLLEVAVLILVPYLSSN